MRLPHTAPTLATLAALAALTTLAPPASAVVVRTTLATPLTTPGNPGGGNNDGTGVWFNPLTGYAEQRGYFFPGTLFADGQFFLLRDDSFAQPEAQVFTQGFFSRGNGVIYASASNLNPARFGLGAVIGPGVGLQSPGAGYTDLGPSFGNWTAGGQGFLGLTLRDPAGGSAADIFYGYADITVNDDYSITLYGFAYETVRGAVIVTAAAVPEVSTLASFGLGLAGLLAWARRRPQA